MQSKYTCHMTVRLNYAIYVHMLIHFRGRVWARDYARAGSAALLFLFLLLPPLLRTKNVHGNLSLREKVLNPYCMTTYAMWLRGEMRGVHVHDVCLVLVPDLEYGLPVQVRDHGMNVKDNLPQSDVNKEYFLQNVDNQVYVYIT